MDCVKIVNNIVNAYAKKVIASRPSKPYTPIDSKCKALKNFSETSDTVSTETGIRIWIDCPITIDRIFEPRISLAIAADDKLGRNSIAGKEATDLLQARGREYLSLLAKAISMQNQAKKLYDAIDDGVKQGADTSVYKVGEVWAGTYGYSMILAKFAILVAVLPKSLKFQLIGDKPAVPGPQDPADLPVVADPSKKGKVVVVRMPKDTKYGVRVDDTYMRPWDGKPIHEDHMD